MNYTADWGRGGGGFKRTKERRTTMATMSDAAGKEVALTGAWAGFGLLLRLKASLILGMVRCFPTRGRRTDVCSASPPRQTVDVRATHASAATTPAMASATLLPPLCRFRPLEREVGRMEPYPAAILLFLLRFRRATLVKEKEEIYFSEEIQRTKV